MKFSIVAIFCFALLLGCNPYTGSQLSSNRASNLPPNAEPGKCYAKSIMGDSVDETFMDIPVFTGDVNDDTVQRELKEYVLRDKTTSWIKKKADRNCLSSNPDDCLVWCLVDVPAEKIERLVVSDTTATSEYEIETIYYKKITKKGGYTKWFEVLCENQINPYISSQIKRELYNLKYLKEIPEGDKICKTTQNGLKEFQRENRLPIGNLDFETLKALDVNY